MASCSSAVETLPVALPLSLASSSRLRCGCSWISTPIAPLYDLTPVVQAVAEAAESGHVVRQAAVLVQGVVGVLAGQRQRIDTLEVSRPRRRVVAAPR